MKAIQTQYQGYLFRSRLEARWAVYLDHVGWSWEYEPEGFEFENGTRYLPDFKINFTPDFCEYECLYLEIKPTLPSAEEIRKLRLLHDNLNENHYAGFGIGMSVWSVCNIAYPYVDEPLFHDEGYGHFSLSPYCFQKWQRPGVLMYEVAKNGKYGKYGKYDHCDDYGILTAVNAAKSARFEFGETPIGKRRNLQMPQQKQVELDPDKIRKMIDKIKIPKIDDIKNRF